MSNNTMINLVSKTRGCNYTLAEVLKKGLQRSTLSAVSHSLKLEHVCFYGSKDMTLTVEGLSASESRWTSSVNFRIDGQIPIHVTRDGKLQAGYGCGCDIRHNGQFPSDAPADNPEWDLYKNCDPFAITIWTEDGQIVVWSDMIPSYDEAWDVVADLAKELLVREVLAAIQ